MFNYVRCLLKIYSIFNNNKKKLLPSIFNVRNHLQHLNNLVLKLYTEYIFKLIKKIVLILYLHLHTMCYKHRIQKVLNSNPFRSITYLMKYFPGYERFLNRSKP